MNDMNLQYSPAQILEAARRAEADGRMEYALKFYRHLADQFPSSAEGAMAAEGLKRLSPSRFGSGRPDNFQTLSPHAGAQHAGSDASGGLGGGRGSRRQPRDDYMAQLPDTPRRFFVGRALALLITWGGVLAVLLGGAVVGSVLGNVKVVVDFLGIIPGYAGVLSGVLFAGGGIMLILFGQLALAIFNGVNNLRQIADLQNFTAERDSSLERHSSQY